MNDNKRKLYDRIEKLLRLAGDKRANAHEANLARNIALNLLRKNGITLSTDENETTENTRNLPTYALCGINLELGTGPIFWKSSLSLQNVARVLINSTTINGDFL